VLTSHLATLLVPAGEEARAVNLVSVVFAVATVHLLYKLCRSFAAPQRRVGRQGGAGTGALMVEVEEFGPAAGTMLAALAFPVWGTAGFAEVYSITSAALLAALLLTDQWRARRWDGGWQRLAVAGGCFGVAFSCHHISAALVAPALCWLVAAGAVDSNDVLCSWLVPGLAAAVPVLFCYGSIFVISTQHTPLLNWGGVHDWTTMWWHISGKMYSVNFKWPSDADLMVRCAFFGRNLHSRMPLDPTPARLKRAGV
jgi:hypothetical protein